MLSKALLNVAFGTLFLGTVIASPAPAKRNSLPEPILNPIAIRQAIDPIALKEAPVNGLVVATNTSTVATNIAAPKAAPVVNAAAVPSTSVAATVLILARDTASAYSAYSGLNGYAIPYQVVLVPQAGVQLPVLNSTLTSGNFGAIVVVSEVSYDYGAPVNFQSALTAAQWASLYQYQVTFGIRMVRLDVFPSPDSGTTALGGCCGAGVEQLIQINNTARFPTAGLKVNAGVSTQGLYHYPAQITNSSIAEAFASFAPATGYPTASTAGVINNIAGRQQMVFFIGFATDWSSTSNFLQHSWITWATRGLYTGYRRVNFGTQVDDMFLESDIYSPAGTTFQVSTSDLAQHKTWTSTITKKMPAGSVYFLEIAHNGNGNIESSTEINSNTCGIGPIEYNEQIDTPLEFQKPIGSGVNLWPASPATYPYTTACTNLDALKTWWATPANRDVFAHVSHTFTHEDQNNATFFDITREMTWNQAWLKQVGIASAKYFSPKGLVPPAITGLHNGDALRAWAAAGIVHAVGDNTRPALLNTINEHWPLITTVAANGYAGIQITPRWATRIYYNCHLPSCTVSEWINTSAGVSGTSTWYDLLAIEKDTSARHLLGLHHDPFMFHQANLNYGTAGLTTINGVSTKLSLIQAWVEVVVQEMARLTTWPMISLTHDNFSVAFAQRMARDQCNPQLTWITNPTTRTITGVTLTATGNTCSVPIPVTVPGTTTSTNGFATEKIGADPLTIWAKLTGSPVTFTLTTPISLV